MPDEKGYPASSILAILRRDESTDWDLLYADTEVDVITIGAWECAYRDGREVARKPAYLVDDEAWKAFIENEDVDWWDEGGLEVAARRGEIVATHRVPVAPTQFLTRAGWNTALSMDGVTVDPAEPWRAFKDGVCVGEMAGMSELKGHLNLDDFLLLASLPGITTVDGEFATKAVTDTGEIVAWRYYDLDHWGDEEDVISAGTVSEVNCKIHAMSVCADFYVISGGITHKDLISQPELMDWDNVAYTCSHCGIVVSAGTLVDEWMSGIPTSFELDFDLMENIVEEKRSVVMPKHTFYRSLTEGEWQVFTGRTSLIITVYEGMSDLGFSTLLGQQIAVFTWDCVDAKEAPSVVKSGVSYSRTPEELARVKAWLDKEEECTFDSVLAKKKAVKAAPKITGKRVKWNKQEQEDYLAAVKILHDAGITVSV